MIRLFLRCYIWTPHKMVHHEGYIGYKVEIDFGFGSTRFEKTNWINFRSFPSLPMNLCSPVAWSVHIKKRRKEEKGNTNDLLSISTPLHPLNIWIFNSFPVHIRNEEVLILRIFQKITNLHDAFKSNDSVKENTNIMDWWRNIVGGEFLRGSVSFHSCFEKLLIVDLLNFLNCQVPSNISYQSQLYQPKFILSGDGNSLYVINRPTTK